MSSRALICLHGWGGSKESFDALRDALQGVHLTIYTPDLPGFGNEPEPTTDWTVDDYTDWVEAWIVKNVPTAQEGILLLGHSHGGRIAIKMAVRKNMHIDHLFLCAAAGIRHGRHIKRIAGLTLAKTGKTILSLPGLRVLEPYGKKFLYRLVRVHDYERASEVMRRTMINVSREDLSPLLSQISVPTDIFWGTDDGMTPYSDARMMESTIKNSTLHTYQGVRHSVHKDRAKEIASIIQDRLRGE